MKTKLGSLSKMKLLTVRYSVAMRGASNNETRFPNWFILLVIGLSLCVEYFVSILLVDFDPTEMCFAVQILSPSTC